MKLKNTLLLLIYISLLTILQSLSNSKVFTKYKIIENNSIRKELHKNIIINDIGSGIKKKKLLRNKNKRNKKKKVNK